MANTEHFARAPIVEALIDIRVEFPREVSQEELAEYGAKIPAEFKTRQIRQSVVGRVEFSTGVAPVAAASVTPLGYLFKSEDNLRVVQARRDGFSFSRLQPYTSWEDVAAEANGLWASFMALYRPKKVTRIALRYINRIELPKPVDRLSDYFATAPVVAPSLPQTLQGFFLNLAICDPESGCSAIVNQTIDEQAVTNRILPVILDIDVFREGSFSLTSKDFARTFGPLRVFKNRVFFESITHRARELFR